MVSDFHCVTGWSVFRITWEGVRLSELLKAADFEEAPVIVFHSGDGAYTDSLTWEQAQHPEVILAYQMEGRPLPQLQGGPLRLVIPHMYGYKSVKWVEALSATNDIDYRGYWEERGYPTDAFL
jgi:sulfoxide reductase catalytic subunit YedY